MTANIYIFIPTRNPHGTSWDVWIQSDKARLTQTTGEELGLKTTWNERPQQPQGGTGSAGRGDLPPLPAPAPPLPSPHGKVSEVAQSCPTLCDPWTAAHQAPPSMGFSRQKYWSGLPFLSPGDIPNPGIKPRYPILQAASLPLRY